MQTTPKRMVVDLIGIFFILPPLSYAKKKDVPVDKEHPLLHVVLLAMYLLHIRRCGARHVRYRAKQVCNGA